jgi:hypothetical protein
MSNYFAIVYFPCDKTFAIVESSSFRDSVDLASPSTINVKVTYDGAVYDAILLQWAESEEGLHDCLRRARFLKKEKHFPIEKILREIPRKKPKRNVFKPLWVGSNRALQYKYCIVCLCPNILEFI